LTRRATAAQVLTPTIVLSRNVRRRHEGYEIRVAY
jgi:hypothetical protein